MLYPITSTDKVVDLGVGMIVEIYIIWIRKIIIKQVNYKN